MSFHGPDPVNKSKFGDGDDAASSAYLGEVEKTGPNSAVIRGLNGIGSGNLTLTDAAAAKATMVRQLAEVVAGRGFDAVDLYNVVGSTADPKIGFNEESGFVSLLGPTPSFAFPAAVLAEVIGSFTDVGL